MLRVVAKQFQELTLLELHNLYYLRNVVFVVGQRITAVPEIDDLDPHSHHFLGTLDGELVATARAFRQGDVWVVGRVAVATDRQGEGLGTDLMQQVADWLGDRPAELHAQAHLEGWYASLGWRRVGEIYEEAEIPHVTMVRP